MLFIQMFKQILRFLLLETCWGSEIFSLLVVTLLSGRGGVLHVNFQAEIKVTGSYLRFVILQFYESVASAQ